MEQWSLKLASDTLPLISAIISPSLPTSFQHRPSSSPMDILAGRVKDNGAKDMSRAGEEVKQQKQSGGSLWAAMALKNRSQLPRLVESKKSSSERKKKKTAIGRSMGCAGKSICGTKESAVLSRGSRRSSGRSAASSSRSLKAPGGGGDAFSSVSVSASSSFNSETTAATTVSSSSSSSSSSSPLSSVKAGVGAGSGSFGKKLPGAGGCYYECHPSGAQLDPAAAAAAMALMLPCAGCDEFFLDAESLELHKSTSHAVSELGPGDTSRNVVEIIFRSSWKKKKKPPSPSFQFHIERVLKVRSSGNGAAARLEFERYRARVMEESAAGSGGGATATRCAADGNELLRFRSAAASHCCSLGLANGAALCRDPSSQCELCGIVRDGFSVDGDGKIATAATSGLAHDMAAGNGGGGGEKRAMLVCRVVAGRVKKTTTKKKKGGNGDSSEEFGYDSVSSSSTSCSSELDELFVFDPRAILPCFVVIYTVAD